MAMNDVPADRLPDYHELLRRTDAPAGSSWGLWGTDDQLGALNLLTDERTAGAARLVRTGQVFPLGLPLEEPPQLAWRAKPAHKILRVGHEARGSQPGLEPGAETAGYLWNAHVAAVAADNAALEVMRPGTGFPLHQDLLPLLGIPIGEYWVLDRLAEECARDRSYAFMLVSVPLNLRGGIGS